MDSLTEFASGSSVSTLTALAITSVSTPEPDEVAAPVLVPVPAGVAGPLQAATTPIARAVRPALSIRVLVGRDIAAPLSSIVDNLALTLKMCRRAVNPPGFVRYSIFTGRREGVPVFLPALRPSGTLTRPTDSRTIVDCRQSIRCPGGQPGVRAGQLSERGRMTSDRVHVLVASP